MFSDDSPKKSKRDDQLGFSELAEKVSRAIQKMDSRYGYVLAVTGPWGSGKSTMIELILEALESNSENQLHVVRFEPWLISGHQDLVASFFEKLKENFVLENRISKLKNIATKNVNFTKLAAEVAALISAMSIPIVSHAAAATKAALDNTKADLFDQSSSLQLTYQKLFSSLDETGIRILVVIDEIDRLADEEIRSLVNMVKSLGRLPRVTYLLSYDPEVVDALFDMKIQKRRYLDKIVQHEISLPSTSRAELTALLEGKLEKQIVAESSKRLSRIQEIFSSGISDWLKTPRDVVKLSNEIRFAYFAVGHEVDVADLIAISAVKLFKPKAFSILQDRSRRGAFSISGGLLSALSEELSSKFIETVFPNQPAPDDIARGGICVSPGFEIYFSMQTADIQVTRGRVENLMTVENSSTALDMLNQITKSGTDDNLVIEIFQSLSARHHVATPPNCNIHLLKAVCLFCESIGNLDSYERLSIWNGTPLDKARRLGHRMLELSSNPLEAIKSLSELRCYSLFFLLFADISEALAVKKAMRNQFGEVVGKKPPDFVWLPSDECFAFFSLAVEKLISSDQGRSSLAEAKHISAIVRGWTNATADIQQIRYWIREHSIRSAEFLERLGYGVLSYSVSSNGESRYFVDKKSDHGIYDLDVLREAAQIHLKNKAISAQQRKIISALIEQQEF